MKKVIFTILIAFLMSTSAQALERCHVGAWNDIDRVGEGIAFEVNPETDEVNGFFYTYHKDRSAWYLLLGEPNKMVMYEGRKSANFPFNAYVYPVGTAKILTVNEDILIFGFNFEINYEGKPCYENCSAEYIYNRITQMIDCDETAPK